jgi:hypothetical protein
MNIEDTKKAMKVMEAFCNGAEVVVEGNSYTSPLWNFDDDPDTYTVKPKPRGVWVRRYPDGYLGCVNYPTRNEAELARTQGDPEWTPLFLQEVV